MVEREAEPARSCRRRGAIFGVKGDDTATNNGRVFFHSGTVWEELSVSRPLRFSGTLDRSGIRMVAHGLGSGVVTKLQTVQAWSKGNVGEALPLTLTYVDGNNVRVTGGTGNRSFYVAMTIVADDISPW